MTKCMRIRLSDNTPDNHKSLLGLPASSFTLHLCKWVSVMQFYPAKCDFLKVFSVLLFPELWSPVHL